MCVARSVVRSLGGRVRAVSLTACSLSQRLVSRFGRARANDRFAVFSSTLRDGRRRLVPQPSRADVARETSPRFSCGTLLHAWTCTSGIESPAFTMAASERERFAAGGSVFALYEACGRAYNNDKWQCQPSEGEALSAWSLSASRRHEPS